jgi:hypothetical protein
VPKETKYSAELKQKISDPVAEVFRYFESYVASESLIWSS